MSRCHKAEEIGGGIGLCLTLTGCFGTITAKESLYKCSVAQSTGNPLFMIWSSDGIQKQFLIGNESLLSRGFDSSDTLIAIPTLASFNLRAYCWEKRHSVVARSMPYLSQIFNAFRHRTEVSQYGVVMKNRRKTDLAKCVRSFFLALASLVAFSCDQPQIPVNSDESTHQVILISHTPDSISFLSNPIRGRFDDRASSDSAFEITYKRFEYISGTNLLVELFQITLVHKLDGDTTLDYGSVTFGGSELYRTWNWVKPVGAIYSNLSMLVNLSNDSSYAVWSDSFRLEEHLSFSATNSPVIKDVHQEISTQEPNRISSPVNGQTISAANDLEITFQRELARGSTITIGCFGSGFFYHFELVKATRKASIPAEFVQAIKDSLADAEYQVAFEENLDIGSLQSENKVSGVQYGLPITERTIGSIVIKLTD
jgi:hypothetical protein